MVGTMVTHSDIDMDQFILEIFEEQEDEFYFPVTSQKQARAFVKALRSKGISYEDVCHEIGEFEHNFSAWRKGLGRIGIGNRMIQRINQPLQEILMSDDEDDDDSDDDDDAYESAEEMADTNHNAVKSQMRNSTNGLDHNLTTNDAPIVSSTVSKTTAERDTVATSASAQNHATNAQTDSSTKPQNLSKASAGAAPHTTGLQVCQNTPSSGNKTSSSETLETTGTSSTASSSSRSSPELEDPKQHKVQSPEKKPSEISSSSSSSQSSSSASPSSKHREQKQHGKEQNKELASAWLSQIEKKMKAVEKRIDSVVDKKKDTSMSRSSSEEKSEPEEKPVKEWVDPLLRRKESPHLARKETKEKSGIAQAFEKHQADKPSLEALLKKNDAPGSNFQRGDQDETRRSVRDRISMFNHIQDSKKESPRVSRENSLKKKKQDQVDQAESPTQDHKEREPTELAQKQSVVSANQGSNLDKDSQRESKIKETKEQQLSNKARNESTKPNEHEKEEQGEKQIEEKEFESLIDDLESAKSGSLSNDKKATAGGTTKDAETKVAPLVMNDLIDFMDDNVDTAESSEGPSDQDEGKDEEGSGDESSSSGSGSSSTESVAGSDDKEATSSENSDEGEEEEEEDNDIEIDESYDSDIDLDNDDKSSEFTRLLEQLSSFKGRLRDGPGYIYAFTDSTTDAKEHRVKVGVSRYPNKRLEQAAIFNIDIKLASAISVCSRRQALKAVLARLEKYQIKGQDTWFKGPLETILDCMMSAAEAFPVESSDC